MWTFDADGDFSASQTIWQINSNGSCNVVYYHRGRLQRNVPSLSVVGFAVLGACLMFVGVRVLRQ